MQTQNFLKFEPKTSEESDALKAIAKAMKIKYTVKKLNKKEKGILSDFDKAVKEMKIAKKSKSKKSK